MFLSMRCKEVSLQEGFEIAKRLMKVLMESRDGIGLAANQIGIQKQVCIVNVTRPLILINPIILSKKGEVSYEEACLSFPGDYVKTNRYAEIEVKGDNHEETLYFSKEKNLLECICVQHEIDHLNGITMYDRRKE